MADSSIPINGTNPAKALHTETVTLNDGSEAHDEYVRWRDDEEAIAILMLS